MSNRVDATVQGKQGSPPQPAVNGTVIEAQLLQLPPRYHPVLPAGQRSNRPVHTPAPPPRNAVLSNEICFSRNMTGKAAFIRHDRLMVADLGARVAVKCDASPATNAKEAPARRYRLWL